MKRRCPFRPVDQPIEGGLVFPEYAICSRILREIIICPLSPAFDLVSIHIVTVCQALCSGIIRLLDAVQTQRVSDL